MPKAVPFSRGVNFSKWFESRTFKEIEFTRFTEQDFANVKSLGADVIRVPVAFHNFIADRENYTLEPELLKYLDAALDWAQNNNIYLIIDNHSFHPINATDNNIDKILIPVWRQLAHHFKNRSRLCIYEILNEPHGITDERWCEIQSMVIAEIRKIDPKRLIIIGGTGYNSIEKLYSIPAYEDDNLIYTFHFYDPHLFTHQGASWNKPSLVPLSGLPFPLGENSLPAVHETFKGTWVEESLKNYKKDSEFSSLCETLDKAADFSKERNVPVFCGEFGVLMNQSPQEDRVKWYKFVCGELDKRNISWTSWDYYGGFGLFKTHHRGEFPKDLNTEVAGAMGFKI